MPKDLKPSAGLKNLEMEEKDVDTTLEEGSNTKTTVPTDLTVTESTFSSTSDYSNTPKPSRHSGATATKYNVRFQDDISTGRGSKLVETVMHYGDNTKKYSRGHSSSRLSKDEALTVEIPRHHSRARSSTSTSSSSSGSKTIKSGQGQPPRQLQSSSMMRQTLEEKYYDLLSEINQIKLTQVTQLTTVESELKLKSYELKRISKLLQETEGKLQKICEEKESAQEKIKTLTEQLNDVKYETDRKICDLTMELHEKSVKLSTYEKIQAKIDQILFPDIPAIDAPNNETDVEGILSSYGYSANIPINSKVRLQQSLDLAKRLASERDHLDKSREEAQIKLRDMEKKYQDLLIELNHLKLTDKREVSELESELKLKKFELERLSVLFSESERNHKTILLEKERLAEKLDVLKEEFSKLQTESGRKITALTLQLQEKGYRLETYDRLEAELDKVVIQAAALPSNQSADEILAAYGYGASIPSNAKRRLEQSLQLARRVLQLEHRATEQKEELFKSRDQNQLLREELDATKAALMHSGHPTTELLELIKKRNIEIGKLNEKVKGLELRLEQTGKSNLQLQAELTKGRLAQSEPMKYVFKSKDAARFSSHSLTFAQREALVNPRSISSCNPNSSTTTTGGSTGIIHIKKPLSFSKLTLHSE